jgi:hypothetical protein
MLFYELYYSDGIDVFQHYFRASGYDKALEYAENWVKNTGLFLGKSIELLSVSLV